MKTRRPFTAVLALLIALFLSPSGARACAVCMGADENTGEALNGAIFLMLGCIGSMMAFILAVAYAIWRRASRLSATSESPLQTA